MLIKRQHHSNKRLQYRIALCVFLILVLFVIPGTRRGIRNTFVAVATPVVRITDSVGTTFSNIFQTLRYKSSLVAENSALTQKNLDLTARVADYDELSRENQDLKTAMNRGSGAQFTLAAVLSKPPVSLYDTLIIDGGSKAGLQVGQTVYVNGDIPIGSISEVFSHVAVVTLYSAPAEKIDARLDPAHIDVTLFGHGGGDYLVSVPHDFAVETD